MLKRDEKRKKKGGRRDGVPLDCHWLSCVERWISVSQWWPTGTHALVGARHITQTNVVSIVKDTTTKKKKQQNKPTCKRKKGDRHRKAVTNWMVMVNVNNHRPPRQYTSVISLSAHTTTRHFRSLCEMHNGYKRRHAGVYALIFSLHLPSCPIIYTTTYLGRGRYVCKRLYSEQETVELRHHSLNNFHSISKAQTFYTPNCIPFYTLSLYMLRSLLIYINLA